MEIARESEENQRKATQREYAREWRRKNREKANAQSRAWSARNPDKKLKSGRLWRKNNQEHANQLASNWRHNNPEKTKESTCKYRKSAKELISTTKMHYGCCNPKCCYQGEFLPIQLDFHHIDPATKLFGIGASNCKTVQKLKEEIAKCTVLCANCHRLEKCGYLDAKSFTKCIAIDNNDSNKLEE